ncbi:hypothetical protein LNP74_25540 [Klebsiella pneumoniae subsp. pneumoniae]|nr:hypothetical protein [Klebsiella pneumoniae subsp. pneumoniae]
MVGNLTAGGNGKTPVVDPGWCGSCSSAVFALASCLAATAVKLNALSAGVGRQNQYGAGG